MPSNTERYKRVLSIASKAQRATISGLQVVLLPGVFPQCAVCGKDCRTLENEEKHILVDSDQSHDAPMLCRSCRSVVCQECAHAKQTSPGYKTCPHCGASAGLLWAVPFAFCDACGKRAALFFRPTLRKATFQLLDQGAVPFRCTKCGTITCAVCLAEKRVCPNCGGTDLGIFLPAYDGTGPIAVEMPRSKGNQRAESLASLCTEKEIQMLQGAISALQAPPIKFWISKEDALKRLMAMGAKASPALDMVTQYLRKPAYRISAIRVLAAIGPASAKMVPTLIEMLNGKGDDAGAAALALAAISVLAREEARKATPVLQGILQRKRSVFGSDTGLRCCAAIALFAQKEIDSETATQILREHAERAIRNPSLFPPGDYLQEIVGFE